MQGYVFVQSEEEYETGEQPQQGSCIRIDLEGLRFLCEKLKDYIEYYPNYHFRLKTSGGQNLYLCLRIKQN